MEKLNQCIEDVLDFDYQHLTTDDSDGRSFYFALKRLEDYYENLKEVESPVPPKDHIVLTNNEDRWYKPCMCCVCKAISICTPTHDFYVTHDHGDKLICEQCYCEYLGQRLNYSDRQDTE